MQGFCSLIKKDIRLMASGKFFLMWAAFLILYTLYVNLGYVKFMKQEIYPVYLYDPAGTQKSVSPLVHSVSSKEELDAALLDNSSSVGIDASTGEIRLVFYRGTEETDRHRADYAFSLLHSPEELSGDSPENRVENQPEDSSENLPEKYRTQIVGTNTPEQKARKEITCELLFFEIAAVGFLGIAAVLFKEKSMGVIRIHAALPIGKNMFLMSKLVIFLVSDLVFALLLTLLNVGFADAGAILPGVLLQTMFLSLIMALLGIACALLLKDFRQFTLAYLLIAVFAATPVFLSANTPIKMDWIHLHPFYHIYMGLKNAYFGTPGAGPFYYLGCLLVIILLFFGVRHVFFREMEKEG